MNTSLAAISECHGQHHGPATAVRPPGRPAADPTKEQILRRGKTKRILEAPSNDIDTVLNLFSAWNTAFVGYNTCDAPFYLLVTSSTRSGEYPAAARSDILSIQLF